MAKKNSKFADFDYKKFLLEKGEIVGIGVAGAVMALLLVGGILKSLGASPSKNASSILSNAVGKQKVLEEPKPLPKSYNALPSDLVAAVNPKQLDPDSFALPNPWFKTNALEDTKWREPQILALGPATCEIVQSELAKLGFNPDGSVDVRVAEASSSNDDSKAKKLTAGMDDQTARRLRRSQRQQQQLEAILRAMNAGGGMRGRGMMGGGMQMMGMQMMGMQMMGGRGAMGGSPMMPSGPAGPGFANPGAGKLAAGAGSDKYEIRSASIEEALKKNLPLARVAVPAIQAVISAEFPYKKQMEAIRKALHYPSVAAMLADPKVWIQKGDPQHPDLTINFLGFRVWRQAIAPDGRVVQKWQPVDLETPYLAARLYHDKEIRSASDKDAELKQYGLIVTEVPSRLVWPLLPLLRTDEKYADVVDKLPDLKGTLEKLKKETQSEDANKPPPNPYVDKDPFGDDDETPATGKSGIPTAPGAGPPGFPSPAGPGGMSPKDREKLMKQMSGAGGRSGPPPSMFGPAGPGNNQKFQGQFPPAAPGMTTGANAPALPDWCLVRFIDVTVQPGMTYQYKVQLRLANPLYNRKDQAVSEGLTFAKEIYGPDEPQILTTVKDSKRIPLEVHVPDNPSVYAVDEKPANARYIIPATKDRVAIQIHRWISRLDSSQAPIGEWAIAERQLVRRGEYIGQPQRVELPIWSEQEDKFLFATDSKGPRQRKGVLINFTTLSTLIDFEGGKEPHPVGTRTVIDDVPIEMLVMTPDGRLIVRNGAVDSANEERKERLKAWRDRQKAVKEAVDEEKNSAQNGPSKTNPFNFGRPGGVK